MCVCVRYLHKTIHFWVIGSSRLIDSRIAIWPATISHMILFLTFRQNKQQQNVTNNMNVWRWRRICQFVLFISNATVHNVTKCWQWIFLIIIVRCWLALLQKRVSDYHNF